MEPLSQACLSVRVLAPRLCPGESLLAGPLWQWGHQSRRVLCVATWD